MSKKKNKRGPDPIKRREIILSLRNKKVATSAELGVHTAFMFTMLQAKLVERAGLQEREEAGRKKVLWKLSKKGEGIASSLLRKKNNSSRAKSAAA
jgi:hypothetical protein